MTRPLSFFSVRRLGSWWEASTGRERTAHIVIAKERTVAVARVRAQAPAQPREEVRHG